MVANFENNSLTTLVFVDSKEDYENDSYNDTKILCKLKMTKHNWVLVILFTIIFCLSVIGNCLVIVTIVQQRWMRTVTNFYLLNLAISDLLLSVICMPPTLISLLVRCFLFGEVVCKLLTYLQPVSVTASAYTLAVIALERYFAICRPLHSRHWQTRSHAAKMICIVWAISFISNISALVINRLETLNDGRHNCRAAFSLTDEFLLGHQVVLTVALFVLPLCLMVILYGLVIRTLWLGIQLEMQGSDLTNGQVATDDETETNSPTRSRHSLFSHIKTNLQRALRSPSSAARKPRILVHEEGIGDSRASSCTLRPPCETSSSSRRPSGMTTTEVALRSTHMEKSLLAKKRVIKMLLTVVFLFFLCWTPIYTFHLILYVGRVFDSNLWNYNAYITFTIMAYLSSLTNPMTYCFLNRKFRQAFLLAFGCRRQIHENYIPTVTTAAHAHHNHLKAQLLPGHMSTVRKTQKSKGLPLRLSVVEEKSPDKHFGGSRKFGTNYLLDGEEKLEESSRKFPGSTPEVLSLYDNLADSTSPVQTTARLRTPKKTEVSEL